MSLFTHPGHSPRGPGLAPLVPQASTTDPMSIWEEVERPASGQRTDPPTKQDPPARTKPDQKKS